MSPDIGADTQAWIIEKLAEAVATSAAPALLAVPT